MTIVPYRPNPFSPKHQAQPFPHVGERVLPVNLKIDPFLALFLQYYRQIHSAIVPYVDPAKKALFFRATCGLAPETLQQLDIERLVEFALNCFVQQAFDRVTPEKREVLALGLIRVNEEHLRAKFTKRVRYAGIAEQACSQKFDRLVSAVLSQKLSVNPTKIDLEKALQKFKIRRMRVLLEFADYLEFKRSDRYNNKDLRKKIGKLSGIHPNALGEALHHVCGYADLTKVFANALRRFARQGKVDYLRILYAYVNRRLIDESDTFQRFGYRAPFRVKSDRKPDFKEYRNLGFEEEFFVARLKCIILQEDTTERLQWFAKKLLWNVVNIFPGPTPGARGDDPSNASRHILQALGPVNGAIVPIGKQVRAKIDRIELTVETAALEGEDHPLSMTRLAHQIANGALLRDCPYAITLRVIQARKEAVAFASLHQDAWKRVRVLEKVGECQVETERSFKRPIIEIVVDLLKNNLDLDTVSGLLREAPREEEVKLEKVMQHVRCPRLMHVLNVFCNGNPRFLKECLKQVSQRV